MLKSFYFICIKMLLMVILATKFSDCRSQITLGSGYALAKFDYFDIRVVDGFYEKTVEYDKTIYNVTYYIYKLFDDVIPEVYVWSDWDAFFGNSGYTKLEWDEFYSPICDDLRYVKDITTVPEQEGVQICFHLSKSPYTYIDEIDYEEVNSNSSVYDSLGRLRGTWSANSLQSGEIGIVGNKLKGYKFIKR